MSECLRTELLRMFFNKRDLNKDNSLSLEEVLKNTPKSAEQSIKEWFKEHDTDCNKQLSWEEFKAYADGVDEAVREVLPLYLFCADADNNTDQKLDRAELEAVLRTLHGETGNLDEQVNSYFEEFGKDPIPFDLVVSRLRKELKL